MIVKFEGKYERGEVAYGWEDVVEYIIHPMSIKDFYCLLNCKVGWDMTDWEKPITVKEIKETLLKRCEIKDEDNIADKKNDLMMTIRNCLEGCSIGAIEYCLKKILLEENFGLAIVRLKFGHEKNYFSDNEMHIKDVILNVCENDYLSICDNNGRTLKVIKGED